MERQEIREKLEELLGVVDEELARKADLRDDAEIRDGLGLDSLQIVELLFEIEEQLGAKIADEEAQKLRTVGDLLDVIEQKLAEGTDP